MKQTRDDDEDANAGEFRGHQFVIDEAIGMQIPAQVKDLS